MKVSASVKTSPVNQTEAAPLLIHTCGLNPGRCSQISSLSRTRRSAAAAEKLLLFHFILRV